MARLQTFPDGLKIACGRTEMQRMVGNAVPSLIAEILARQIRRQLLGTPLNSPLRLLPPRRRRTPAAEPTASLPAKYRALIGSHADHPGEGKGRGALRIASQTLAFQE
jgi:DNA (cytosine-5)-methyltransferase 1